MSNKIHYIVLYSKYSDLENMVPIVNELLETEKSCTVAFIFYGNDLNPLNQRIIQWFQKKFQIRVTHIDLNLFNSKIKSEFFIKILYKVLNKLKRNSFFYKIIEKTQLEILEKYLFSFTKQDIYDNIKCFYGFSKRKIIENTIRNFINYNDIKWIRLPQGVMLTISSFRTISNLHKPANYIRHYDGFSDLSINSDPYYYNTSNALLKKLNMETYTESTMKFLGAPRFSKSWISILDNEIFNDLEFSFPKNGKKNILFLLTPWKKNVWIEETSNVIDLILKYDVNIIVKGFHGNTGITLNDKIIRDEKTPTTRLIKDADAIIYIATSAILDAYMRNKEVLHLDYLHANKIILNEYTECVEAKTRDEVHVYMNNFIKNGVFSKDKELKINTEKFIEERIVTKNWKYNYLNAIEQID